MKTITLEQYESTYENSLLCKNREVKSVAEDIYRLAGYLHREEITSSRFKEITRRILANTIENAEMIKTIE